jgi:hypothetical protein
MYRLAPDQETPMKGRKNHSPRGQATIMTNSQLAKRVIRQIRALTPKLKELEADLRRLWVAFERLKPGQKILGCKTKVQFCEKKLHRTPRAIRHLLYGRTIEERPALAEQMKVERERNNVPLEPEQEILPPGPVVPPPKKPVVSVPIELGTDDAATMARAEAMHRMVAYLDRFEGEEFEVRLDAFIKDLRAKCARSMRATA